MMWVDRNIAGFGNLGFSKGTAADGGRLKSVSMYDYITKARLNSNKLLEEILENKTCHPSGLSRTFLKFRIPSRRRCKFHVTIDRNDSLRSTSTHL